MRHVCLNCPTRWSLITRLRLKSPPAGRYVHIAPHWALFPGGMIFLAVLSINYIGDGLRDALDPRRTL